MTHTAHIDIFPRLVSFAKKNTVAVIAFAAAAVTAFFVPPDRK